MRGGSRENEARRKFQGLHSRSGVCSLVGFPGCALGLPAAGVWPSGSWHTWLWQRAPSRTLTVPALGCTWASLPELSARAGLGSGLSHQTSVCAVRLGPREPCFPVLCWCSLQDCASVSRSANWGGRGRGNEPHQPVTGEGGVGLRGWRYLPKPGLRFTVRSPPPPRLSGPERSHLWKGVLWADTPPGLSHP